MLTHKTCGAKNEPLRNRFNLKNKYKVNKDFIEKVNKNNGLYQRAKVWDFNENKLIEKFTNIPCLTATLLVM